MVVDSSIIASMTFETSQSSAVTALYERNPLWEAPYAWKGGFLNVLSIHYRRGLINYQESLDALRFAERLIGPREHSVPATAVLIDSSVGPQSLNYSLIRLRAMMGRFPDQRKGSIAIILPSNPLVRTISLMMRTIAPVRIYSPQERDKALAWLRESIEVSSKS